jgi:GTPase SAR1 family protein
MAVIDKLGVSDEIGIQKMEGNIMKKVKLIGIVGMPGTGKTTMMREWIEKREWVKDTPLKLLDSMINPEKSIRLFGKYEEGDTFAGTDKLSMAVQPVAIEYLNNPTHDVNIFEGDRLTSVKFFQEAERLGHEVHIIVLEVSDATREQRYKDRGSDQSETFINGRRTKVQNIIDNFSGSVLTGDPSLVTVFNHETPEDTQKVIDFIEEIIG